MSTTTHVGIKVGRGSNKKKISGIIGTTAHEWVFYFFKLWSGG